ncbi:MAG: AMIN domain-containing protein [Sulfurospirillaceae bacterium]|nr:AMIN domain-containing protein [Sulfurospirillaceae bacterium]MDD2826877.1 AMIN domain-containing protein [Sulfurospirillaceae bacterium]
MTKIASLLLLCVACISARENPFEMTESSTIVGKTTQIEGSRTNFESATLKLPSSARILKSVSITFQNLDGSISEEIQSIDKDIDWHHSLIIQPDKNTFNTPHNETPIPLTIVAPESKKNEITSHKKESVLTKTLQSSNQFALSDTILLDINENALKILTRDIKVRDFLISDPYKIVVDFQKISTFATKTISLQKLPFVSATLGNHDNFYRIAIALDGQYRYDIQKVEEGYLIRLK